MDFFYKTIDQKKNLKMKPADEPVFLFSATVIYLLSVLFDPTVPRFRLMECVLPSA
jgi:hypothetical protein